MSIRLSALSHISVIVDDAAAAGRLLGDVFDAPLLQRASSSSQQENATRIVHAGLGDVRLQFIQPGSVDGRLHRQLREHGPQVHSLAFFVADLVSAETAFAQEGIAVLDRSDIDLQTATGLVKAPVCVFATMARLGFNIELIGATTSSRVAGDDDPSGDVLFGNLSPLLHVELAVDDLDDPCVLLQRLFGSGKVESGFAEFLGSLGSLDIVHVNLGNVVLQYCRPKTEDSPWAQLLARRGRAIHNITWLVRDMSATVAALARQDVRDLRSFSLDFGQLVGHENLPEHLAPQRIVDLMSRLGFHMELTEAFASNIDDFIFNPFGDWEARPQLGSAACSTGR
ncbi:MAG: hypothetical protein CVV19_00245 [Gammaproteobacteria bacterium HGW-Gammaproteobacteria-9]|uniref:VOC family protein n=1 Tax=Pseudomonas sp. NPDC077186 TaxID=3364421 RepID=UPI000CAE59DA|nr:MAG: hypothetical protein CVV19_00245 [Gammaproteobacteria bacterium HGW-Gammaproteobacteria-9]